MQWIRLDSRREKNQIYSNQVNASISDCISRKNVREYKVLVDVEMNYTSQLGVTHKAEFEL